jgi:hypothetical protein
VGSHQDVRAAEGIRHPYNRSNNPNVDNPASEEEKVDGSAEKTICQLVDAVLTYNVDGPCPGPLFP